VFVEDHDFPKRMRSITRVLIVHEKETADSNNEDRHGHPKELLSDIVADRLIPYNCDRIFWNSVNSGAQ